MHPEEVPTSHLRAGQVGYIGVENIWKAQSTFAHILPSVQHETVH